MEGTRDQARTIAPKSKAVFGRSSLAHNVSLAIPERPYFVPSRNSLNQTHRAARSESVGVVFVP